MSNKKSDFRNKINKLILREGTPNKRQRIGEASGSNTSRALTSGEVGTSDVRASEVSASASEDMNDIKGI